MIRRRDTIDLPHPPSDNPSVTDQKLLGLDGGWLDELLRKRRSNFSCVLVAETDDPARAEQVKFHFVRKSHYSGAQFFVFDPWLGLRSYDRDNARFVPTEEAAAYRPETCGESSPPDAPTLAAALRRLDGVLKAQQTVVFLQWLDVGRQTPPEPALAHALRSWALDPDLLRNGSTVVVIANHAATLLDEATRKLLAWRRAPLTSGAEREHIIRHTADCLDLPPRETYEHLVMISAGLSLHQLESSLLETYALKREFSPETLAIMKSEVIRQSDLVEVQEPDPRGFRVIGGYTAVKEFVTAKFIRKLQETTRAKHFGASLPRGLLLFGPPGTGKTMFAKALSGEINLPFIHLHTENLYSKWLGESGQRFAEAIRLAEQMSPGIVFIDEIDRFGRRQASGGDGASQESQRVFSQILEWLGDSKRRAIIVGTTNDPEALDDALLREGRLDFKIPFLFPGVHARREILRIHLTAFGPRGLLPTNLSGAEFDGLLWELAKGTEGLTGAELEHISLRARDNAFESGRDIAIAKDLTDAAASFRVSAEKRARDRERFLELAAKFTNDQAFLDELAADR